MQMHQWSQRSDQLSAGNPTPAALPPQASPSTLQQPMLRSHGARHIYISQMISARSKAAHSADSSGDGSQLQNDQWALGAGGHLTAFATAASCARAPEAAPAPKQREPSPASSHENVAKPNTPATTDQAAAGTLHTPASAHPRWHCSEGAIAHSTPGSVAPICSGAAASGPGQQSHNNGISMPMPPHIAAQLAAMQYLHASGAQATTSSAGFAAGGKPTALPATWGGALAAQQHPGQQTQPWGLPALAPAAQFHAQVPGNALWPQPQPQSQHFHLSAYAAARPWHASGAQQGCVQLQQPGIAPSGASQPQHSIGQRSAMAGSQTQGPGQAQGLLQQQQQQQQHAGAGPSWPGWPPTAVLPRMAQAAPV